MTEPFVLTPEAFAASRNLQTLIANEIHPPLDWISFARFMELALYAPGLGYYNGGATKLGAAGDFITAPELTPLFGATLAHVAATLMAQTTPNILEFGAGSGKLAFDLLTECKQQQIKIDTYAIIELSGELRARQQAMLRDFPQVVWLDTLPVAFSGVIFANEVLDAMPVHLVVKTEQGWQERGVSLAGEQWVYADRTGSEDCQRTRQAAIPNADELPIGYLTEIHPAAEAFMQTIANMLGAGRGGVAILIDYGFPAHEYYLAQRHQGTLMCHYRHRAHTDPFFALGLQDITAHVNFSAMAQAAQQGGVEVLGYTSQAAFLLNAGLGDLLSRASPDNPAHYLPHAQAVQKLTSPAEMGELFKVLAVGIGVDWPEEWGRYDRGHQL